MQRIQILNTSKQTKLAGEAEYAKSFWQRGRGLLGRDGLAEEGGMVFEPCSNIHMLGMKFALDVVFLDKAGRVLKLYPDLKPWRPYAGARKAHMTLELPVGTIAKSNTTVGDVIALQAAK